MREEHKLKMLKNGVLCKVFGFKRENVTGHWRKLQTEELNDFTCHKTWAGIVQSV